MSAFGMGPTKKIPVDHRAHRDETLEELVTEALMTMEHLWIARSAFRMTDEGLLKWSTNQGLALDSENLINIEISCVACRLPFRKSLVGKMCLGRR